MKTGCKSAHLIKEPIRNIPQVKSEHKNHGIGQCPTASNVLLASHADVEEYPKDQSRSELIERLEVERADRWV